MKDVCSASNAPILSMSRLLMPSLWERDSCCADYRNPGIVSMSLVTPTLRSFPEGDTDTQIGKCSACPDMDTHIFVLDTIIPRSVDANLDSSCLFSSHCHSRPISLVGETVKLSSWITHTYSHTDIHIETHALTYSHLPNIYSHTHTHLYT